MWEVPLETQQSEAVKNKIMAQTNKPELTQYLHAVLFNPKTAILTPHGNKTRFPEDLARHHRKTHQEESWKIKEHNNGTPANNKTRNTTNQRETSRYIPGRQE